MQLIVSFRLTFPIRRVGGPENPAVAVALPTVEPLLRRFASGDVSNHREGKKSLLGVQGRPQIRTF